MKVSLLVLILLLSLPFSCTKIKAKKGDYPATSDLETNITEQSPSLVNLPEDIGFVAFIGGFSTRHSLLRASTETQLSISIEKDKHANLSGIEQYINLERFTIYLHETSDVDFTPLKSLSKLEIIEIHGWTLTELSDLSGIPSFSCLFIDSTSLTNLNGLEKIPQLEYLEVSHTFKPITDTSALHYLKRLKELRFRNGSYIIDFNNLKDLPDLEIIYLSDCEELDLTGIDQLKHLKKFDLITKVSKEMGKRSVIKNIEEIGRVTSLKELYIDDLLTSVEFLSNNTSLEYLELISGKDRDDYTKTLLPLDILPLVNLKKLKYLTIRGFEIKNEQVIKNLPELEVFNNALYDLE